MQDDLARSQADLATDLTPANIAELGRALDKAKDPTQRAILMQELDRLKGLAGTLLGPVQPPAQFAPPRRGVHPGVWNPTEPESRGVQVRPIPGVGQFQPRPQEMNFVPPPPPEFWSRINGKLIKPPPPAPGYGPGINPPQGIVRG